MYQDVLVIGATGKVGRTLIKQIFDEGDTNNLHHENPTRVIGLASSKHVLYSPKGITREQAYDFVIGKSGEARGTYAKHTDLVNLVNAYDKPSNLVFIDVTSLNEQMREFHLETICNSPHSIVTANKNPVALSDYDTFQTLTSDPRRYGYRCSVMAGADTVPFLRNLRDLNDNLVSIQGCFSGTLGYISSQLEKGRKFSDVLQEARQSGYTEPHPRDDLSGVDVCRKLVVLARTTGFNVSMVDVKVEPFIPVQFLFEENIDKFLNRTKELDAYFAEKIAQALDRNHTIRYVASLSADGSNLSIRISLEEVPRESPLGRLEGELNKIVIVSKFYPKGYTIESPGAGLEVTARNIRNDLLDLLPKRKIRL